MSRPVRFLSLVSVTALTGALVAPGSGLLSPAHAAGRPTCHGQVATIVGTPGADTIRGTAGDDVIVGLGGEDVIHGGRGDDVICSGGSRDWAFGDSGNDRLYDSRGTRGNLSGGPGADILRMTSENALTSALMGGPGDDVLVSAARRVQLYSDSGRNRVRVLRPAEVALTLRYSPVPLRWDGRSRTLTGRGRKTTYRLARGSRWQVGGTRFADVLLGTGRGDGIAGGGGRDVIRGRGGNDSLSGDRGADHVYGGNGDDYISSSGRDVKRGGAGNDSIFFGTDDRVYGGSGNDSLLGWVRPGSDLVLAPGLGQDLLRVGVTRPPHSWVWAHALLDLRRHLLVTDGVRTRVAGRYVRVLVLPDDARTWTVNGTSDDDDLEVAWPNRPSRDTVLHGRAGDDLLLTDGGDDRIFGGSGHDRAFAGDGVDTCSSVEGAFPGHADTGCETSSP